MRKFFIALLLLTAGSGVVLVFITATTYIQLGVGVILYIILAHFTLKTFPRKEWAIPVVVVQPPPEPKPKEAPGISDIDKRAFLKLVGGVGISLFLFSLFNRRAENMLFKSFPTGSDVTLTNSDGKKINPSERQAMDGYRISDIDDNVVTYYGFTNPESSWIIMREDTDTGTFRYIKGNTDYSSNWTRRETLGYDYFHNVFKLTY